MRLAARGLAKRFAGGEVEALADVSIELAEGEFVSIVGPSGCGKSTLLAILAGLILPSAGEVLLDGTAPADGLLGAIGYMPQRDLLMEWRTTLANATLGLELAGVGRGAARERALAEVGRFGLAGFEDRRPSALSGGMRQRAALLRTFLAGRDVLLLDEPFGALDALTREAMREWLLGVWEAEPQDDPARHPRRRGGGIPLRPRLRHVRAPGARALRGGGVAAAPTHARADGDAGVRAAEGAPAGAAPRRGPGGAGVGVSTTGTRLALALGGRLEPRPRAGLRRAGIAGRAVPPLIAGVALLALWQAYVAVSGVRDSIFPLPLEVGRALVRDRSVLLSSAWTTLSEILLGYGVAIVVGIALAVAVSSSRLVERAIYPWLVVSQMIPIPALAPVVVLWTGFDIRPKLIVIALVTFFPIAVNTIDGLRATDSELVGLLRTLGAGRWEILRIARLPGALPYVFSGLRVAAAFAVIGAVFAEWAGATSGLGYLVLSYNTQTLTPDVFAVIVVLAVIGVALFAAVGVVERLAVPWWRVEE